MSHHILIADADETFAAMLRQSLEEMDGTRAHVVASAREALEAAAQSSYDLVIVDLGLPDSDPSQLVRALRQKHPHLRLMVVPLDGETAPPELADIDLQGTLSKPFFLPELPERIEAAFSQPLSTQPAKKKAVADRPAAGRKAPTGQEALPEVSHLMSRLAQEVGAEAVLLSRGGELIAQACRLPAEEVAALAAVICDSWRTSARVAQILGKEQLRFEQSIEGEQHLLYSLALADETILSVIVQGKVPLGMIRHRAKETAEAIRELIGV